MPEVHVEYVSRNRQKPKVSGLHGVAGKTMRNGWRFPRLTREGWYFLFVLLFVIGGAVARHLNLLVLLAGLMVGPLVLHARWVTLTLRGLQVRRRLPRRIHAGEPLHVRLAVENHRKRTGAWLLQLQDTIRQTAGPAVRQAATQVLAAVPVVDPTSQTWVTYRAHFAVRGQYTFGPIRVVTRFPLGLLESGRAYPVSDTILVGPRLGQMTEAWRRLVLAEPLGVHASHNRQGLTEADYYGLREWRPGDSVRWVHWRTTARLGEPAVRQFERQRNFSVALLLDLWLPSNPSPQHRRLLELAVSFAATALADLVRCGSGRLAVAIAGKKASCFSGQATAGFVQEVTDALSLEVGGESTLPQTVEQLFRHWPTGATGVVISTRSDQRLALKQRRSCSEPALNRADTMRWIDVASSQINTFFQWKEATALPPELTLQVGTHQRNYSVQRATGTLP